MRQRNDDSSVDEAMADAVLEPPGAEKPRDRELADRDHDPGLPFSGAVNKVKPDGTSAKGPVGQRATGYTIIDAASLDKATKVAKGCPLLKSGGSISVYETASMM